MKRKWINILAATVMVSAIALTGCSSSQTSTGKPSNNTSQSPASDKKEKVVLDLWWPISSNDKRYENHFKAIELFNKEHPNIEIHPQSIPYDKLHQKIVAAASAGNAPDLTVGLNEWITEFSKMGILPDLTTEVNNWSEKDKIPKSVWSAVDVDGKIVGIPQYIGIRALLYHKDALNKAGITAPPKTWDEMIEDGKKLKEKNMIPFGLVGKSVRLPQELIVYLWQNGTDIAQKMPDGHYRNTWQDSPEELKKATEVFAFYKRLQDEGIISKDEVNWGYTEMDTNFAQGRVAMSVNGAWLADYEKENPETMKDVEITQPIFSKQPSTFLEVNSMLTYKNSKHQKEAIQFMEWWASKEAQQLAWPSRSVRSDVVEDSKWGKNFSDQVNIGRSWPHVALGGILDSMNDSVQMVLLGKSTPEETAKWLSDKVNKSLKENGDLSEKK